jgi:hypothetical protein
MFAEWSNLYLNPCQLLGDVDLKFAQACMARDYGQLFLFCPWRTDLDIVFETPGRENAFCEMWSGVLFFKLVSLNEYVLGELLVC